MTTKSGKPVLHKNNCNKECGTVGVLDWLGANYALCCALCCALLCASLCAVLRTRCTLAARCRCALPLRCAAVRCPLPLLRAAAYLALAASLPPCSRVPNWPFGVRSGRLFDPT